ncbi:hypothetical protein NDU88_009886 [Pleurodeles waltl]|uniref:Uncharacterized protein n=1 Tax=Pleurodeles waltl TaxID=8319 RepID=A0AAV7RXE5_PLEWA|nr:hypothetical protein NDU88_009886 [Pleurodeles waltl]
MGHHKRTDASQGNTMEQYTTPVVLPQRAARLERWLEMWDKVAPGRTEGSEGVAQQSSGAESPDWRSHGTGQLAESCHRVEIQRIGTMAVVPAELVGCTALEQELEAGGDAGMT